MELSFNQELVHQLKVFQAMRSQVVTLSPQDTMRDAQDRMRETRVSGLPVVDYDNLVGIVTVEDIIKALDHGHIDEPVGRWMTTNVVTVERRWPLAQAMSILDETGFGQLPVLGDDGRLCGMITPETILRAMLVQLNRLLARDEERESARTVQEGMAVKLDFAVEAKDYDRAGLASVRLKRELASRGVEGPLQRRVAIATHEAETNLIIHTLKGGHILAEVEPSYIRLTVSDEGPGIDDIERAMTPGYSTASDFVRDLGFGAGMGLPNIRRCADRFDLRSAPGLGTRLTVEFDRPGGEGATSGKETQHP